MHQTGEAIKGHDDIEALRRVGKCRRVIPMLKAHFKETEMLVVNSLSPFCDLGYILQPHISKDVADTHTIYPKYPRRAGT